jgi:aminoglycoside phosphotransferase (APT) family kinase protein
MHADEVDVDDALVRQLLVEQFPEWASRPAHRFPSVGTDHVLYRLGDDMVVRLPRQPGVEEQVDKERRWLPRLAPLLPCSVPVPLAKGQPAAGYPFSWSVYRWLVGETPAVDAVGDGHALARELARFITALHAIDATGGPSPGAHNSFRGVPLAERDEPTRRAIAELEDAIDVDGVTAAWEHALAAPEWSGPAVWIHGDITFENVLVRDGQLAAVIDFGCLGVGDPACDLPVAWSLLDAASRSTFRHELAVDDAAWARGRGWALSTGLIALPYYGITNPPRADNARYRIAQVLADFDR